MVLAAPPFTANRSTSPQIILKINRQYDPQMCLVIFVHHLKDARHTLDPYHTFGRHTRIERIRGDIDTSCLESQLPTFRGVTLSRGSLYQ